MYDKVKSIKIKIYSIKFVAIDYDELLVNDFKK